MLSSVHLSPEKQRLMLLVLAIIVFSSFSSLLKASEPIKFVYPKDVSSIWHLKEMPLYDSPHGEQVGSFALVLTHSWCIVNLIYSGDRLRKLDSRDYFHADGCLNLYIHEIRNGYFKILNSSLKNGAWINSENRISALPGQKLNFEARSILSTLRKNTPTFAFEDYSGLEVKLDPTQESETIAVLDNNFIIASATGNTQGLWAEVEVFEVNGYPTELCADKSLWEPFKVSRIIGWIKALSDDGYPINFRWFREC